MLNILKRGSHILREFAISEIRNRKKYEISDKGNYYLFFKYLVTFPCEAVYFWTFVFGEFVNYWFSFITSNCSFNFFSVFHCKVVQTLALWCCACIAWQSFMSLAPWFVSLSSLSFWQTLSPYFIRRIAPRYTLSLRLKCTWLQVLSFYKMSSPISPLLFYLYCLAFSPAFFLLIHTTHLQKFITRIATPNNPVLLYIYSLPPFLLTPKAIFFYFSPIFL